MKIAIPVRSSLAQVFLTALSAGSATLPKIEIYDGSMPSSVGDSIAGTLLATFELTSTVGTESDGVITFETISPDANPPATGTAAWARSLDRDGAEVVYLTVSEVGLGGEVQLSTTDIVAGEPVSLTSGVIRAGA